MWGGGESAILKGSVRSDGSVHVVDLLSEAKEILVDYGGHEFSGGFSVLREDVHKLHDALEASYEALKRDVKGDSTEAVDAILPMSLVTRETWQEISRLAPFGQGNPKPLFLFEGEEVIEKSYFGKQKNHLKLIFRDGRGRRIPAIKFFVDSKEIDSSIDIGKRISFTAHIELSMFRNIPELRLRIVEIN